MAIEAQDRLVFVSHSSTDLWVAKQIAREITSCGAKPFLDEAEIGIGKDFEEDILKTLEKAHEFVVLLTPWALTRPYVWLEVGAAWYKKMPIIGLLHGMTFEDISAADVPVLLKKRDLISLNEIDKYLGQLKTRVQGDAAGMGAGK